MLLKIGDFSKKTGLSIRTLRYYDEINLFKPKEIDMFTGYRYYSDEQLDDIKIINEFKDAGFSLEEIKENWNNFSDGLMNKKKQELLEEVKIIEDKIRKLDYLRSNIVDGKIIFDYKDIPKPKKKTLM